MRKSYLKPILSFFLFYSVSSSAQKIQLTQNLKKEIDNYVKSEMKAEQIPGLSYAVILNDKIIDSGAYGLANVELKAPVTMHSLFSIGSIEKTFTAPAIIHKLK
jgi:CubicO group peptidase (beta-lactamase class C family)